MHLSVFHNHLYSSNEYFNRKFNLNLDLFYTGMSSALLFNYKLEHIYLSQNKMNLLQVACKGINTRTDF